MKEDFDHYSMPYRYILWEESFGLIGSLFFNEKYMNAKQK